MPRAECFDQVGADSAPRGARRVPARFLFFLGLVASGMTHPFSDESYLKGLKLRFAPRPRRKGEGDWVVPNSTGIHEFCCDPSDASPLGSGCESPAGVLVVSEGGVTDGTTA